MPVSTSSALPPPCMPSGQYRRPQRCRLRRARVCFSYRHAVGSLLVSPPGPSPQSVGHLRDKKLIAHSSLPAPSRRRCCHRARRGQSQPADGRDGRLGLSCHGYAQPKVERVDARPTSTQRRCRGEETTSMDCGSRASQAGLPMSLPSERHTRKLNSTQLISATRAAVTGDTGALGP